LFQQTSLSGSLLPSHVSFLLNWFNDRIYNSFAF
jgi:hypothetical protein